MSGFYDTLAAWAESGALPEVFGYPFFVRGLLAVLLAAPLFGTLSHIVVTRRLAFLSATLGHAAITGLTLGLALGEPLSAPYGGMFGFVALLALGLVWVRRRSALSSDTLIGVFLSLTLGLGVCLLVFSTRRFDVHRIEAVLFGSLLTVTDTDLALLFAVLCLTAVVLARHYNELLFDSLSPQLAGTQGQRSALIDYAFVLLLALATVAALKIVGALLIEALAVVPAAAARNVARTTRGWLLGSVAIALSASIAGLALSAHMPVPPGGAIVLCLAGAFFLTLLRRR